MHVHRQLWLIILLLGIREKVKTGELFSLLWKAWFSMVSVQGGQDLSISYLKQSCFSYGVGSFKERIHKQFYSNELWNFRLMVLKTLALTDRFLLCLKPVKIRCYRITHVHIYHSFHSTIILWKFVYLIVFGRINPILPGYLISSCPPPPLLFFLHHPKTAQDINLKLSDFKDTPLRHFLQVKPVRYILSCCHGNYKKYVAKFCSKEQWKISNL